MIQKPHTGIQIPGKAHPNQVRNQELSSQRGDGEKPPDGDENADPQKHQHQKSGGKAHQAEKHHRPEEIKKQLHKVSSQGRIYHCLLHPGGPHETRGIAHEQIKGSPHHRKHPAGRGQWGLNQLIIQVRAAADQDGQPTHRQGQGKTE